MTSSILLVCNLFDFVFLLSMVTVQQMFLQNP